MAFEKEHGHSSSGDPQHPKALFPTAKACPACWRIPEGVLLSSLSPPPPSEAAEKVAIAEGAGKAEAGEQVVQPTWDLDQVANYLYL